MTSTRPRIAALQAAANWRRVEFISDLHLQPAEPATASLWRDYLAHSQADAIFILGDLFEVWVGDDGLDQANPPAGSPEAFEQACVKALKAASQRCALFLMHGNRDFLIAQGFAQATGVTLLEDPTVLAFADQRWLLSHGDALCLEDQPYLEFRAQVRSPAWQQAFLARPLTQRREIAAQLRTQSEQRKAEVGIYADVDTALSLQWLQEAQASCLIHGHTHRPGQHPLDPGRQRVVLSDWDALARPPRAEVLRLTMTAGKAGAHLERLTLASST